jgi:hypothetical protein
VQGGHAGTGSDPTGADHARCQSAYGVYPGGKVATVSQKPAI